MHSGGFGLRKRGGWARAIGMWAAMFSALMVGAAQRTQEPNPELRERPPAKPAPAPSVIEREGKIQLDVVVTDAAGVPIAGLQPWDFKILDDDQARRVLTFHAFNGTAVKPDPPVEVILMLDMVNLSFQQVAFVRQQVEQYLREDGGRLKQPVAIMLITDRGLQIQRAATLDGNAQARVVQEIKGSVSSINAAMGGDGLVERFQLSVKHLETIAENEARVPGRKLLIWVGPGWPILNGPRLGSQKKDRRRYFDGIVELSTRLREARLAVYSVSPQDASLDSGLRTQMYRDFLKGVKNPEQADSGNLALKVLASQTGGLILGPDNDVAGQIARCVEDANRFYRISFDPPRAEHVDEYHELHVVVNKPGVTVRTNSGYYNEP